MHTPIVLMVVGIPGNVNNIVILVKDYKCVWNRASNSPETFHFPPVNCHCWLKTHDSKKMHDMIYM